MGDYMMDVANRHLDYEDHLQRQYEKAPRRWMVDEKDFESFEEARDHALKMIKEQWQKLNGEWEDCDE